MKFYLLVIGAMADSFFTTDELKNFPFGLSRYYNSDSDVQYYYNTKKGSTFRAWGAEDRVNGSEWHVSIDPDNNCRPDGAITVEEDLFSKEG